MMARIVWVIHSPMAGWYAAWCDDVVDGFPPDYTARDRQEAAVSMAVADRTREGCEATARRLTQSYHDDPVEVVFQDTPRTDLFALDYEVPEVTWVIWRDDAGVVWARAHSECLTAGQLSTERLLMDIEDQTRRKGQTPRVVVSSPKESP